MTFNSRRTARVRGKLLLGTALVSTLGIATGAYAAAAAESNNQLAEVVVTAQKREQSLQDVPIAVTALTSEALQTNRITSVSDLSGMAPGVMVRTAAGGSRLPSFSIRGAISYGVVAGSDKQVSLYLDGVYLASARGTIFELPDVTQIELLRGPQGTLFGRNATAGAVSITTRDPTGQLGFKQQITVGNYDQFRTRTSVNLPEMGPFSAYATVVHSYKRGDIKNASAGVVWDRSTSPGKGRAVSPKYLGTLKDDAFFGALKFEPNDVFKTVYKFDYDKERNTPEGTGFVGINGAAAGLGPGVLALFNALAASQPTPVYMAPDGKRPKIVSNGWAVPSEQTTYGHSLTSTFVVNDSLTFKNIAAYRHGYLFSASPIDGFSSLIFTQQAVPFGAFLGLTAARVGQPINFITTSSEVHSKQWSDELQANYDSKLLTITAGLVGFHSNDRFGPLGIAASSSLTTVPNGILLGRQGVNYNRATSLAAYSQVEVHATEQIDVVGGIRITKDKKDGEFVFNPAAAPTTLTTIAFHYRKTKPNFLVGLNYKPDEHLLFYGKYSTAFVSGGSVAQIDFLPETVESFEGGFKGDFLENRLRTNLALYHATYKHFQTAQGANNFPSLPNSAVAGTIIVDQGGPVKAKGFEFEATALPMHGVTVGGSLGYMDTKFSNVNPLLIAQSGGDYKPALRAKWTGGLSGQYDSEPVFGEATLRARVDGTFHGKFSVAQNPTLKIPAFAGIENVSASWNVNGRIALRDIAIGGGKAEAALWVKNLTQNKEATFTLRTLSIFGSANYVPARTFGLDLTYEY